MPVPVFCVSVIRYQAFCVIPWGINTAFPEAPMNCHPKSPVPLQAMDKLLIRPPWISTISANFSELPGFLLVESILKK